MLYRIYQRSLLSPEGFLSGKFFLKTKSILFKKCQVYIYIKIRSLLFPCTVFYSDKTSRLHAAQNTAPERLRKAHHPELLFYISSAQVSNTPAPSPMDMHAHLGKPARAPCDGELAAITLSPRHPTNQQRKHRSPPQKDPQVRGGKERNKNYGGFSRGAWSRKRDQINLQYITFQPPVGEGTSSPQGGKNKTGKIT